MMKNFFSILTTLAIILSATITIKAEETTVANDTDKIWRALVYDGKTNAITTTDSTFLLQGTPTVEASVGKKSSTDKSVKLDYTPSAAKQYGNFKVMSFYNYTAAGSDYIADSTKRYAVIGTDFYLDSTSVSLIDSVRLDREQGRATSDAIDISTIERDTWNNIYYVVDLADIANKNISYSCYLNGELIKSQVYSGQYNTAFPSQFRILFFNKQILNTKMDDSEFITESYGLTMHIDNFEYFVSDVNPVGDVYNDFNNFNSRSMGNINLSGLLRDGTVNQYENGVAGKTAEDYSFSFMTNGGNPQLIQYKLLMPQRAFTKYDFLLYLGEDTQITALNYQSGWTVNVANTTIPMTKFNKGKWNRITYVFFDLDGTFKDSNRKNSEFYTYVNGELLSTTTAEQCLYSGNASNPYDMRVWLSPSSTGEEIIVDDYSVTQSALPPIIEGAPFSDEESATTNVATLTNKNGVFTATATLDNAIMLLGGYDDEGKLIDVQIASDNGDASLSVTNCSIAKAYIWENTMSIKPLTEAKKEKSNYIVACWGDSLTFGQGAHTTSVDNSYPAVLSSLTGLEVNNMGVGGETVITFASRQGAFDIKTTEDFTIPSTCTPVTISFYGYNKDGSEAGMVVPRDINYGGWTPITIAGVEGKLNVEINNDVWPRQLKSATFTRSEAGEEVMVSIDTPIYPSSLDVAKVADINIIAGGSNGGWDNSNGSANYSTPDVLIKDFDTMIANTKDPSKYIIIDCFSQNKNDKQITNDALFAKYDDHLVKASEYLRSDDAFEYAGITKTDNDTIYLNQGYVPYSFLNDPANDKSHLNAIGYKVLAKIVYDKMVELGYAN